MSKEYIVCEKGMEFELFDAPVIDKIYGTIRNKVIDYVEERTKSGRIPTNEQSVSGSIIITDLPLKKGGTTNIYIEYNVFSSGLCKIPEAIIFHDEVPDAVLDKMSFWLKQPK